MRLFFAALCAGLVGCIDFDGDLRACLANPHCVPQDGGSGGGLPDGGNATDGGFDAGCAAGTWCIEAVTDAGDLRVLWGSSNSDIWVANTGDLYHWDGSSLTLYPFEPWLPAVPGFSGFWGSGSNDVWMVGSNWLEHWDGGVWFDEGIVGSQFAANAVCGTGPNDAWVVGQAEIDHWNGSALARNTPLGTSFVSCAAASPSLAWAVDVPCSTNIWGWDGGGWGIQTSNLQTFNAIAAGDATHVWAVGDLGSTLVFDGSAWDAGPIIGSNNLNAIFARSASELWVVGANGIAARVGNGGVSMYPVASIYNFLGVWGPADAGDVWAIAQNGNADSFLFHRR